MQSLRIIELAVSLRGAKSLIEHPATMTNGKAVLNYAERKEQKIEDGLIRFRFE